MARRVLDSITLLKEHTCFLQPTSVSQVYYLLQVRICAKRLT
jgi:hypothetical protein